MPSAFTDRSRPEIGQHDFRSPPIPARFRARARNLAPRTRLPLVPYALTVLVVALAGLCARAISINIYAGLWYPIVVAGVTVVIGWIFLRDNTGKPLNEITGMK